MGYHYITRISPVRMDGGVRRNKRDSKGSRQSEKVCSNGRQRERCIDSQGGRIQGQSPFAAHPHTFNTHTHTHAHTQSRNWETNQTSFLFVDFVFSLLRSTSDVFRSSPQEEAASDPSNFHALRYGMKPMVLMSPTRTCRCCKPITSFADSQASPFESVFQNQRDKYGRLVQLISCACSSGQRLVNVIPVFPV